MPPLTIGGYFSVPIAEREMPNADRLNAALKSKFLEWERNEGTRTSVPTQVVKEGVYESDFSLFHRKDPDVQRLAEFCLSSVGELTMRLNRYSSEEMRSLRIYHHSWYHITRTGGYTGPHNHPMASWSGVYCVDPGESHPERPESGVLRLLDNRTTANMYIDAGNAYMASPYTFGNLPFSFRPAQLVLFPSYVFHEVAPFWGDNERITVAFNCWIREADRPVDEPGVRLRDPVR